MTKIFKNAKKMLAGLLVIALAFVITLGVADAAPQTITVKRFKTLEDMVTNYKYGFIVFTTSDGQILYCVDPDKKALTTGTAATFSKNGDAGLLYLLENGYPNKEITGNDEIDMYITQAAVWWYMDETGQAGKFPDTFKNATTTDDYGLIPDYIKPMVAKAKAAKDTQVRPSMSVSTNGTTMKLTSDGKYYESNYMSASLTGSNTYNVKLSGATTNTVVVDENGNIGTTFNSGKKFKVRVPVLEATKSMNITVNFTTSGNIKTAKIYAPADTANYQRVAGLYTDTVTVSKTASLKLTPNKHYCEIVGDKYYGKDGTEVDKKTYTKECKHICEFTDDKYYGKDGTEVDKKTFKKQCSKSCEIIDDKYYGKDGSEVDKKTFEKQCSTKYSCQIKDDKYYGIDGAEVDKDTYNSECGQEVVVPNTSSNVSSLAIILGSILMLSGTSLIAYRRKMLF